MAARFVTSDGNTVVDVIKVTPPGATQPVEQFRIRRHGYAAGTAGSERELRRLVPNWRDLQEA